MCGLEANCGGGDVVCLTNCPPVSSLQRPTRILRELAPEFIQSRPTQHQERAVLSAAARLDPPFKIETFMPQLGESC